MCGFSVITKHWQLLPFLLLLGNGGHSFREDGVLNYTTMLVREDLNLLILGAREAIFALDLANITFKKSMVRT